METKNQQKPQKQKQDNLDDKLRNFLILYVDIAIRGVISLIIMIALIFGIKYFYPDFNSIYIFIMVFIGSIFLSPLLSKIKLGHKIADKYMLLLNNIVYKLNRGAYKHG
jgi:hypothetical protein